MKKMILPCVAVLALMGGCAHLTEEQKARVEVLTKQNNALTDEMAVLLSKAKAGTATPLEIVQAVDRIRVTLKSNADEMKAIQDTASTSSWIAGAIGLFGRTALHAVSLAVPGSGPLAAGLQALLTLLLGGSSSKEKKVT